LLAGGLEPGALLALVQSERRAPLPSTPEDSLHARIAAQLDAPAAFNAAVRDAINYARLERFKAEPLLVPDHPVNSELLNRIAASWQRESPHWLPLGFRPPAQDETAIELPYKLVLSPHAQAGFAHATEAIPRAPGGRVELWHSRLGTQTGQAVNEADDAGRSVRAVWSRSGLPLGVSPRRAEPTNTNRLPPERNPPYHSLDANDRWSIVHLSADFENYQPEPIDVRRLTLSSLGGWLDSQGTWTRPHPADIALREWRHLATMGRDHYVRVVYEGLFLPWQHRVALVKITERRFHPEVLGNVAYLRQRMLIVIRERDRTYVAPGVAVDGELLERTLPFNLIRICTLVTPPLQDPSESDIGGLGRDLFLVKVGGRPFLFDMIAETITGELVRFSAPAIFGSFDRPASTGVAGALSTTPIPRNLGLLKQARDAYEQELASTVPLGGQRVTIAKPQANGDTTFACESLSFSAHVLDDPTELDPFYDLPVPSDRKPGFFPKVSALEVQLPAVQVLTGVGGTSSAKFAQAYAGEAEGDGFGGANIGEVLLEISSGTRLDFSAKGDRSGGLVQPSITIKGFSRKLGPVAGIAGPDGLQEITNGNFTAADYFAGALGPKLFGAISLADVIQSVSLGELGAVPKFISQLGCPWKRSSRRYKGLRRRPRR
jgi:hypothetical protein